MKQLITAILILASLSIFFGGCSKEDSASTAPSTSCYTFVITSTTTVSPPLAGYPQTTTVSTDQCGLTDSDAVTFVQRMTTTTTASTGGYTVTVTQTCRAYKK